MNSTNETFYPLDYWLSLFGYSYITDMIFAYIITPIWLLSLILSIFSLFILFKTQFFASNFFNYMRLYVANCLILSVIGLTTILATTHRFFSFTNTYEAVFFSIYFYVFTENSFILFSSSIEICLAMERILYLLPRRFKKIKLVGFKKFFFALFIFCLLANMPPMFLFEPGFSDVPLNPDTLFRIWRLSPTTFSFSLTGQIFNYLGNFLRDVLPMVLKLIINSASIYLVGKYVKNKQRIRRAATTANSELVNFDRKQTYIAIIMNILSLIEHLCFIITYVLFFIGYYKLASIFIMFGYLVIAVKHLLIFFVLLLFNNLFRNVMKNCFRKVPVQ